MEQRYLSFDDVGMRLRKTMVRYKGKAFWIASQVPGTYLVHGYYPSDGHGIQVDASDPELDISSPPLGNSFVEEEGRAYYVTRGTDKSSRQGLDTERLIIWSGSTQRGWQWPLQHLAKTVDGEFPTFSDAKVFLQMAKKKYAGMPFGRYLSLHKTDDKEIVKVRHLVNDVGLYFPAEGTVLLTPRFNEAKTRARLDPYMVVLNKPSFHVYNTYTDADGQ